MARALATMLVRKCAGARAAVGSERQSSRALADCAGCLACARGTHHRFLEPRDADGEAAALGNLERGPAVFVQQLQMAFTRRRRRMWPHDHAWAPGGDVR